MPRVHVGFDLANLSATKADEIIAFSTTTTTTTTAMTTTAIIPSKMLLTLLLLTTVLRWSERFHAKCLPSKRINQSNNQPTNQPTNQSINQSTNQSTNQPTNQSINQPTNSPHQSVKSEKDNQQENVGSSMKDRTGRTSNKKTAVHTYLLKVEGPSRAPMRPPLRATPMS